MTLVVKTQATWAGTSLHTRARSFFLRLTPTWAPVAIKPCGLVTPPILLGRTRQSFAFKSLMSRTTFSLPQVVTPLTLEVLVGIATTEFTLISPDIHIDGQKKIPECFISTRG